MMTKDQIKEKLQENPEWTPAMDASDEEWELYDEVRAELGLTNKPKKGTDESLDDEDFDNEEWEDDEDWDDDDLELDEEEM